MKKLLLSVFLFGAVATTGSAQRIYNMADSLNYLLGASGWGQNTNTPSGQVKMFDDINFRKANYGNVDSFRITAVDFAVFRRPGAPATTATLWYARYSDSANLTLNNLFLKPVVQIASVTVPAYTGTGNGAVLTRFGDSLTTLFRVKADTGRLYLNHVGFFLGVSFSDTTGAGLCTGGSFQDTIPNQNAIWFVRNENNLSTANAYQVPVRNRLWIRIFGTPGAFALPVALGNFTGVNDGGKAVLQWNTTAEVNNQGFGVERSTDGRSFKEIGFVKAAGSASDYRFTDEKMPVGEVYYRLRMQDKDGAVEFSKVVTLRNLQLNVEVYPNPVVKDATIRFNLSEAAPVQYKLVNMQGQVVKTGNQGQMAAGAHNITLNIEQKGSYQLVLTVGDQQFSRQIIKQ